MAATIAAVYPHMNHIGGDGSGSCASEPAAYVPMAPGPAGANATIALYREHGHDEIPPRGPLAASRPFRARSAAGMLALEAAHALGGKLPLALLLEAAIPYARDGYVVSPSQARLSAEKREELAQVPGFAATFLPEGSARAWGSILRQSVLAATIEQLAHAGLDDFYRGDVGREIAADLARIGSPVTRRDLEHIRRALPSRCRSGSRPAPSTTRPRRTQGLAALLILALFERLRVTEPESFDHVHGLIEATKRAFLVRDRVIGDPAQTALDRYFDPKFLDVEALKIDRKKAAPWPAAPSAGDTIWMGAADADGCVVSYIQSLYWEFGSGCVLPGTGVLMQNRGAAFSLDARSPRALAPGRLPFHTLNPALAVLKDGRIMAYGSMGGDGQPQTQAALFTRHVIYGAPLDRAIDAPRWLLGRTWGSPHTNLRIEPRLSGQLIDRLMSAGHDVEVLDEPHSDLMGHAGAVVLNPDRSVEAAHDPRADGGADGV